MLSAIGISGGLLVVMTRADDAEDARCSALQQLVRIDEREDTNLDDEQMERLLDAVRNAEWWRSSSHSP